jgi:hypothetical protein
MYLHLSMWLAVLNRVLSMVCDAAAMRAPTAYSAP